MVAPRKSAFAEESAEVEVLFANMEKLKGLTKKIQGSMNRLETSGKSVGDAIGPIYGNTQKLQIANTNVDRILDAIERMRKPLEGTKDEERILKSNPRKIGLSEYISSLDRTTQAVGDLKRSNLKSNQQATAQLNDLLRNGATQLEDLFRDMLREDTRAVEPLHFITKNLPFPTLPEEKLSQLRLIHSHVHASISQTSEVSITEYPTAKIFAEVRGEYMTTSLRNLAAASVSTARKTNQDAVYKPGTSGIGTYAQGVEGMAFAEYENICPIFAREEWGLVSKTTCRLALNEFAKTLRDLNTHIKSNLITDCFLAFEIIDVVSNLADRLSTKVGSELKGPMAELLKPIRETAKTALPRLLEDTKTRIQGMVVLPSDGSTVTATTETMTRLQTMTAYLSPLSSIMTSLGDGGWDPSTPNASSNSLPTLKSFDVGADGKKLFAHYAADTIDVLIGTLESRSRLLHKTKHTTGIFLANNIAVIDRMIRSSDLSALAITSPKLETWRKKSTAMYLEAWREPSSHLLDVQYTNRGSARPQSGAVIDSASVIKALSSKDKDAIKEKFKAFNTSFEECVSKHKGFRLEKEVRVMLARDIQGMIEPLYGRFWDRYHDLDKGKGKYVRWDKGQLGNTLTGLAN